MTVNGNSQPKQSKKAEKLCAGCLVLLILVSFLAAGCRSKDNIEFADAQAMADELAQEGYIPDDWVYIDYWYPGHFNFGRIVLVYIDQDLYESHKSYWLEGVEPESLYPGYEPEEPENVFHLVNITAQTDGSREAAVYMTGTYYKYVNRLEANYHKPGTEYIAYTRLALGDSDPVARFRFRKKLLGGYSAELLCGPDGDSSVSEETVKEQMHDKKWTENYYDINPRRTGKEIAAAMQQQGLIPADMRLVYTDGEKNIYIPSELYDSHKSYWLEGTDEKDLCEGINDELRENGDHVFWEIEVTGITRYSEQEEKYGITFKPHTSYYCAMIYRNCLFYRNILHYSWDGFHEYTWKDVETVTASDYLPRGSTEITYWCHYEDGQLVIEKAEEE
jgi:hypothetical protein